MLHNANQVLKVEEEFDQYDLLKMKVTEDWTILQRGVFMRQAASDAGGAPCTELISYNPFDDIPGCGSFAIDQLKRIKR